MSFAVNIVNFGKKTTAQIERLRRGVTIKLFSAVIMDTPVDKGRLRGNWRCQVGSPQLDPIDRLDEAGAATITEMNGVVAASPAGDTTVCLSNNLPYAARIEYDGWSHTKAPEGMVRKNVVRFVRLLKEEAAKSK